MSNSSFNPVLVPVAVSREVYGQKLLGRFDTLVLSHPTSRWVLLLLVGVVLIVPSVQFVVKIHDVEWSVYRLRYVHDSAVGRWLPDAVALVEGADPYGIAHWFPAPPAVLMAIVPFASINLTVAAVLWSILKIAAVVGGCWLIVRSARAGDAPPPLGVLVAAAIFSTRPLVGDITHGNINIFVFCEIALAWYLFVNKRDVLCGVVVGLSIVTKVTPGLLLVYFVYKRAWRVVVGAGLGVVLFAFVIPTMVLGFDRNLDLLSGWFRLMIEPYVAHGFVTVELKNQSLSGALTRILAYVGLMDLEHISAAQGAAYGALVHEMARPASAAGQLLIRGINLGIVAALAWLCRNSIATRHDPRLLLELSLILLGMYLLSERTWKHHLTALPIVYLATWLTLACFPWPKLFTGLFVAGLVAQLLLLVVLKGDRLMYAGVITLGLLLCFVQNAILLRRLGISRDEVGT